MSDAHPASNSGSRRYAALAVGLVGLWLSVLGLLSNSEWPWVALSGGLGGTLLLLTHLRTVERATKETELVNGRLRLEVEIRRESEDSQRLAKEAALAAADAKSAFLANVNRELRTPLNVVVRSLDRIALSGSDEQRRGEVVRARRAAITALGTLDDLLDLTQVQTGTSPLESRAFDPARLIRSVAESMSTQATEQGLSLKLDVAPELPSALSGDPGRLRQIVTHLMSNAIQLTRQGTVMVNVGAELLDDRRVNLRVTVTDSSPGVTMEDVARACDTDEQAEDSDAGSYARVKRGLNLAHQLARQMNARLEVTSRPGCGSTSRLEVPLRTVVESALGVNPPTYTLAAPTAPSR